MASYATKRDWWLLAVLWISFGFMVLGFVSASTEPVAPWMKIFAASFFAAFGALMAWVLVLPYRTTYTLEPESLTIRVGPFKHAIPLSEITEELEALAPQLVRDGNRLVLPSAGTSRPPSSMVFGS